LFAAGTPFWVCVPVDGVPTPAFPGAVPNAAEAPRHGEPPPASPELGRSGEETPGWMMVLCPTGGPEGTVGVCGVVNVPCAAAAEAARNDKAANAKVGYFIFSSPPLQFNSLAILQVPIGLFAARRS
jgi:hypothetical protein